METEVMFRGEKREVEFTHEGDDIFDWSFVGMGAETHNALNITGDEELSVQEQLFPYWVDWCASANDYD